MFRVGPTSNGSRTARWRSSQERSGSGVNRGSPSISQTLRQRPAGHGAGPSRRLVAESTDLGGCPAMTPLQLLHMTHLNALVDGYEDTIEHFTKIFGGQVNMRIPGAPDDPDDTDACVFTIGYVIFEFFAPRRRGDKGQGRLLGRFDDHYLGIEFQVPDVSEARSRCEELDIRIINDRRHMFFTYPGSCLGLSWELWEGNFYESLGPDSPQG